MPTRVTPLGGGRFRVSSPGGVKSKSTTRKKAQAQKRLIDAKERK